MNPFIHFDGQMSTQYNKKHSFLEPPLSSQRNFPQSEHGFTSPQHMPVMQQQLPGPLHMSISSQRLPSQQFIKPSEYSESLVPFQSQQISVPSQHIPRASQGMSSRSQHMYRTSHCKPESSPHFLMSHQQMPMQREQMPMPLQHSSDEPQLMSMQSRHNMLSSGQMTSAQHQPMLMHDVPCDNDSVQQLCSPNLSGNISTARHMCLPSSISMPRQRSSMRSQNVSRSQQMSIPLISTFVSSQYTPMQPNDTSVVMEHSSTPISVTSHRTPLSSHGAPIPSTFVVPDSNVMSFNDNSMLSNLPMSSHDTPMPHGATMPHGAPMPSWGPAMLSQRTSMSSQGASMSISHMPVTIQRNTASSPGIQRPAQQVPVSSQGILSSNGISLQSMDSSLPVQCHTKVTPTPFQDASATYSSRRHLHPMAEKSDVPFNRSGSSSEDFQGRSIPNSNKSCDTTSINIDEKKNVYLLLEDKESGQFYLTNNVSHIDDDFNLLSDPAAKGNSSISESSSQSFLQYLSSGCIKLLPDKPSKMNHAPDGDTSPGNMSQGNTLQGNMSQGDTSQGNTPQSKMSGNTSQGNMPQRNTSQGNSSQGNSSQGNTSQGNTSQGNTSQRNMSKGNTSQGNTSQGNTSQGNTLQGNTLQGNMSQGNMSQGNMSQGNMSQGNTSQGNMSQGNTSQGNTSQGNMSQGNTSQGSTPQRNTSQRNTSQGNTSQGNTSQGNTSQGNTSQGNMSQGNSFSEHNISDLLQDEVLSKGVEDLYADLRQMGLITSFEKESTDLKDNQNSSNSSPTDVSNINISHQIASKPTEKHIDLRNEKMIAIQTRSRGFGQSNDNSSYMSKSPKKLIPVENLPVSPQKIRESSQQVNDKLSDIKQVQKVINDNSSEHLPDSDIQSNTVQSSCSPTFSGQQEDLPNVQKLSGQSQQLLSPKEVDYSNDKLSPLNDSSSSDDSGSDPPSHIAICRAKKGYMNRTLEETKLKDSLTLPESLYQVTYGSVTLFAFFKNNKAFVNSSELVQRQILPLTYEKLDKITSKLKIQTHPCESYELAVLKALHVVDMQTCKSCLILCSSLKQLASYFFSQGIQTRSIRHLACKPFTLVSIRDKITHPMSCSLWQLLQKEKNQRLKPQTKRVSKKRPKPNLQGNFGAYRTCGFKRVKPAKISSIGDEEEPQGSSDNRLKITPDSTWQSPPKPSQSPGTPTASKAEALGHESSIEGKSEPLLYSTGWSPDQSQEVCSTISLHKSKMQKKSISCLGKKSNLSYKSGGPSQQHKQFSMNPKESVIPGEVELKLLHKIRGQEMKVSENPFSILKQNKIPKATAIHPKVSTCGTSETLTSTGQSNVDQSDFNPNDKTLAPQTKSNHSKVVIFARSEIQAANEQHAYNTSDGEESDWIFKPNRRSNHLKGDRHGTFKTPTDTGHNDVDQRDFENCELISNLEAKASRPNFISRGTSERLTGTGQTNIDLNLVTLKPQATAVHSKGRIYDTSETLTSTGESDVDQRDEVFKAQTKVNHSDITATCTNVTNDTHSTTKSVWDTMLGHPRSTSQDVSKKVFPILDPSSSYKYKSDKPFIAEGQGKCTPMILSSTDCSSCVFPKHNPLRNDSRKYAEESTTVESQSKGTLPQSQPNTPKALSTRTSESEGSADELMANLVKDHLFPNSLDSQLDIAESFASEKDGTNRKASLRSMIAFVVKSLRPLIPDEVYVQDGLAQIEIIFDQNTGRCPSENVFKFMSYVFGEMIVKAIMSGQAIKKDCNITTDTAQLNKEILHPDCQIVQEFHPNSLNPPCQAASCEDVKNDPKNKTSNETPLLQPISKSRLRKRSKARTNNGPVTKILPKSTKSKMVQKDQSKSVTSPNAIPKNQPKATKNKGVAQNPLKSTNKVVKLKNHSKSPNDKSVKPRNQSKSPTKSVAQNHLKSTNKVVKLKNQSKSPNDKSVKPRNQSKSPTIKGVTSKNQSKLPTNKQSISTTKNCARKNQLKSSTTCKDIMKQSKSANGKMSAKEQSKSAANKKVAPKNQSNSPKYMIVATVTKNQSKSTTIKRGTQKNPSKARNSKVTTKRQSNSTAKSRVTPKNQSKLTTSDSQVPKNQSKLTTNDNQVPKNQQYEITSTTNCDIPMETLSSPMEMAALPPSTPITNPLNTQEKGSLLNSFSLAHQDTSSVSSNFQSNSLAVAAFIPDPPKKKARGRPRTKVRKDIQQQTKSLPIAERNDLDVSSTDTQKLSQSGTGQSGTDIPPMLTTLDLIKADFVQEGSVYENFQPKTKDRKKKSVPKTSPLPIKSKRSTRKRSLDKSMVLRINDAQVPIQAQINSESVRSLPSNRKCCTAKPVPKDHLQPSFETKSTRKLQVGKLSALLSNTAKPLAKSAPRKRKASADQVDNSEPTMDSIPSQQGSVSSSRNIAKPEDGTIPLPVISKRSVRSVKRKFSHCCSPDVNSTCQTNNKMNKKSAKKTKKGNKLESQETVKSAEVLDPISSDITVMTRTVGVTDNCVEGAAVTQPVVLPERSSVSSMNLSEALITSGDPPLSAGLRSDLIKVPEKSKENVLKITEDERKKNVSEAQLEVLDTSVNESEEIVLRFLESEGSNRDLNVYFDVQDPEMHEGKDMAVEVNVDKQSGDHLNLNNISVNESQDMMALEVNVDRQSGAYLNLNDISVNENQDMALEVNVDRQSGDHLNLNVISVNENQDMMASEVNVDRQSGDHFNLNDISVNENQDMVASEVNVDRHSGDHFSLNDDTAALKRKTSNIRSRKSRAKTTTTSTKLRSKLISSFLKENPLKDAF